MKHCHREVINFLLFKLALLPSLTRWHLLTEQGILAAILPLQSCTLAKRSREELFLRSDAVCTAWNLKPGRPKTLDAKQGRGDAPTGLVSFLEAKCSVDNFSSKYLCWETKGLLKKKKTGKGTNSQSTSMPGQISMQGWIALKTEACLPLGQWE